MNANFAQKKLSEQNRDLFRVGLLTFFISRLSFAESDLTLFGGNIFLAWVHASNK